MFPSNIWSVDRKSSHVVARAIINQDFSKTLGNAFFIDIKLHSKTEVNLVKLELKPSKRMKKKIVSAVAGTWSSRYSWSLIYSSYELITSHLIKKYTKCQTSHSFGYVLHNLRFFLHLPISWRMLKISFISILLIGTPFSLIPIELFILLDFFQSLLFLSSRQFTVTKAIIVKK